jgi:hypothetical protein
MFLLGALQFDVPNEIVFLEALQFTLFEQL